MKRRDFLGGTLAALTAAAFPKVAKAAEPEYVVNKEVGYGAKRNAGYIASSEKWGPTVQAKKGELLTAIREDGVEGGMKVVDGIFKTIVDANKVGEGNWKKELGVTDESDKYTKEAAQELRAKYDEAVDGLEPATFSKQVGWAYGETRKSVKMVADHPKQGDTYVQSYVIPIIVGRSNDKVGLAMETTFAMEAFNEAKIAAAKEALPKRAAELKKAAEPQTRTSTHAAATP